GPTRAGGCARRCTRGGAAASALMAGQRPPPQLGDERLLLGPPAQLLLGPLALGDVMHVDRQPRFRRVQAVIRPPPREGGARLDLHHRLLPQRATSLVVERR